MTYDANNLKPCYVCAAKLTGWLTEDDVPVCRGCQKLHFGKDPEKQQKAAERVALIKERNKKKDEDKEASVPSERQSTQEEDNGYDDWDEDTAEWFIGGIPGYSPYDPGDQDVD